MWKILIGLLFILSNSVIGQISRYLPLSTTGQIIEHKYFTLSYSPKDKQAEWVIYLITGKNVYNTRSLRSDDFRVDPLITSMSASLEDYQNSGYDRGHLCPAIDMAFTNQAISESFYLSNISPQKPSFNRGIWRSLEYMVRAWAIQEDSLYIITGPVLSTNLGYIGENKVTIPSSFYKIVYKPGKNGKMIGFLIPNEGENTETDDFAVCVDTIEKLTNIDFFSKLSNRLERRLEKTVDLNQWTIPEN